MWEENDAYIYVYIYIMYIQRTNIHMLMLNIPSMAFQV